MGRATLSPGEGLYLPGTTSIHMLFMRFPIDCVFLTRPGVDGERIVVGVRRALPAWSGIVWHVRGAESVVELPAGTLDAVGVQIGDAVRLEG